MTSRLHGTADIVTGANRGIGLAIVERLVADGVAPAVVKTQFLTALCEGLEAEVAARYPLRRRGVQQDMGRVAPSRGRRMGHRADARRRQRNHLKMAVD